MTAWTELENRSLSEIQARHHALKLSIAAKAKVDTGVKCPSASQRSPEPAPKPRAKLREILVYPIIPEQKIPPEPVDNPVFRASEIRNIQKLVCAWGNVTMVSLLSQRRYVKFVRARQVGMYLASETTGKSLSEIGRRFGNRDHTTVIHAIKTIKALMAMDPEFAAQVAALRAEIERPLPDAQQGS